MQQNIEELIESHLESVKIKMKKFPFWKVAAFGTLCMERQWTVYEKLAKGRFWDASKEIRKVADRFWQAIPSGIRINDKFGELLDANRIDSYELPGRKNEMGLEAWDNIANQVLECMISLMDVFASKDKKTGAALGKRNLDFIAAFCDCNMYGKEDYTMLITNEISFQTTWLDRIISADDKYNFLQTSRQTDFGGILLNLWFKGYPEYAEKKKRKVIRNKSEFSSINYPFSSLQWDKRAREMKADASGEEYAKRILSREKLMPPWYYDNDYEDLPFYFEWMARYFEKISEVYLAVDRDCTKYREYTWLCARSMQLCFDILERGVVPSFCDKRNMLGNKEYYMQDIAFCSIVAGDYEMARQVLRPESLIRKVMDGDLETSIKEIDNSSDDCTFIEDMLRAIINRDRAAFECALKKELIVTRRPYQGCITMKNNAAAAMCKIARRNGMELHIDFAEIPMELLDDTQIDFSKLHIPGIEKADAVLSQPVDDEPFYISKTWEENIRFRKKYDDNGLDEELQNLKEIMKAGLDPDSADAAKVLQRAHAVAEHFYQHRKDFDKCIQGLDICEQAAWHYYKSVAEPSRGVINLWRYIFLGAYLAAFFGKTREAVAMLDDKLPMHHVLRGDYRTAEKILKERMVPDCLYSDISPRANEMIYNDYLHTMNSTEALYLAFFERDSKKYNEALVKHIKNIRQISQYIWLLDLEVLALSRLAAEAGMEINKDFAEVPRKLVYHGKK